jgi:hypothetical protein
MLFGLPWYAIIALASVIGGLVYAYKEKEMELEGKRYGNMRELHELRQVVHSLKSRVENLEAIASEIEDEAFAGKAGSLNDIEIDDNVDGEKATKRTSSTKAGTR